MSGVGDFDDALIDQASQLAAIVHRLNDRAERASDVLFDAVGDAWTADGPPNEREMLKLWLAIADVAAAAGRAQKVWKQLNNAGQSWTVVRRKPHYYADLETLASDETRDELTKELR